MEFLSKIGAWIKAHPKTTFIIAAVVGAFIAGAALAADKGDLISVRIVCSDKATLQAQADAIVQEKAYTRANELLGEARGAGVCAVLPGPVQVQVTETGPVHKFVDDDGDTMSVQVLGIKAPTGATFWTVELRKLDGV